MKTKFAVFYLLIQTVFCQAQTDSLSTSLTKKEKFNYKSLILPATLITGGVILKNSDANLNLHENIRNIFGENFHTEADNYLQFVPIAQIYGGKYLGLKPKNTFIQQTSNIFFANLLTGIVVQSLKHTVKEERPDASDNLSFPSGHTALAFTNASLLFYEYKDSNIWYASSGFLFATTTGIFRIANNKHYPSDVLAGAGIGIISGTLISYWNPFKDYLAKKSKKKTASIIYPTLGKNPGIGYLMKF